MVNKKPFISIILPVYNGEKTLKQTLESLLAQTYTHFELLVGIDGAYDLSKTIAESFIDNRITIYENSTNLGLANNLNHLISLVHPQSEFIAMAEQDDVYVPLRLQWQIEVMKQHPEVGLVSGIAEFITDKRKILFPGLLVREEQFPQGVELFKFLYINQLKVVNTCLMIRKRTHENHAIGFSNAYGNFNVDWDYVLRMSLITQVYGIPKILVYMNRKRGNKSVTKQKWQQFNASRQLLKDFKLEFKRLLNNSEYNQALKAHRKIELGYHSYLGIICYSLYYTLIYGDFYFLKYLGKKIKSYFNG